MSRTEIGLGLIAVLAVAPVLGRTEDRGPALAVVQRAIKAHGGAEALTRAQTSMRSGSGVLSLGADVPFRSDWIVHLPDQARMTGEINRNQLIIVVNGNQGWQSAGGAVTELSRQRLVELQEEGYVAWLATLTPLLQEGVRLTPLPEVKVQGKPALGVKASARGRPEVALYFDKDTGLLVKIARRANDGGQEADKEYFFGGHKDFDGVQMPTKEVTNLNGRKVTEMTYSSYKFLPQVPEGAFARP
jgi:hypothetical protein